MRKNQWMALLLASLLLLSGCALKTAQSGGDAPQKQDTSETNPPKEEPKPQKQEPIYCFIGGILTGSWENGAWLSHNEVTGKDTVAAEHPYTFGEILSPASYSVWFQQKLLKTTDRLSFFSGFAETEALIPYAEVEDQENGILALKLPVEKTSPVAKEKVPPYAFYTRFDAEFPLVAVSTDADLAPKAGVSKGVPTQAALQAIKNQLQAAGIAIEPQISDCVEADFDGDGKKEQLVIANAAAGDAGYPLFLEDDNAIKNKDGSYGVAVYVKEDKAQVISSEAHLFTGEMAYDLHCFALDFVGIYDLNGDGKAEICLQKTGWEWGCYFAAALNEKGEIQIVMRGNYGA